MDFFKKLLSKALIPFLALTLLITPVLAGVLTGGGTLIVDGNMENAGIGDWTAAQSDTTKETGSVNGRGTQVLRVAWNGVNDNARSFQTNFISGETYRVIGKTRSDGTAVPRIGFGGGSEWSGTTSTDWQTFDEVIVADDTTFYLWGVVGATGAYSEFDNVRIIDYKGIPTGQATVLVDGNMENAGVASWTVGGSATLTKDTTSPYGGTQDLRIAWNNAGKANASQAVTTIGKIYRVSGWGRSDDGTGNPRVLDGTGHLIKSLGTPTNWTYFDETYTAESTNFHLYNDTNSASYVEFDNVVVQEYKGTPTGGATVLVDGNAENAGVGDWTANASAILTKDTTNPDRGAQWLKVATGGTGNYTASQANIFVVGQTYRMTGKGMSDGTNTPQIWVAGEQWRGTSDAGVWQYFDTEFVSGGTTLTLAGAGTSTGWFGWDSIRIENITP